MQNLINHLFNQAKKGYADGEDSLNATCSIISESRADEALETIEYIVKNVLNCKDEAKTISMMRDDIHIDLYSGIWNSTPREDFNLSMKNIKSSADCAVSDYNLTEDVED